MEFISACFTNPLLLYAIFTGCLASIMSGAVGTLIVVQRITYISGSISHAILGGMGLFLWLERVYGWTSLSPLLGATLSAIVSAIFIALAKKQSSAREDALITTIWTFGMASGIIFMAKTPGYSVELTNLLIGNILWITYEDILLLSALTVAAVGFICYSFQRLKLLAFDQQQCLIQGINADRLSLILLMLVSISVVALIQIVGIVLVTSMLTLPQMIAGLFSKRLSTMMASSIAISAGLTTAGLIGSFYLDWPAGASIALLSTIAYLAAELCFGVGIREGK